MALSADDKERMERYEYLKRKKAAIQHAIVFAIKREDDAQVRALRKELKALEDEWDRIADAVERQGGRMY